MNTLLASRFLPAGLLGQKASGGWRLRPARWLLVLLFFSVRLAVVFAETKTAGEGSFPAMGRVDSFLQDAGLMRGRVFDVAFEVTGTAWFAAANGLYRYDGYGWQRFTAEKNGLPSNFVRAVMVSRDQQIWVGTDRGAGVLHRGSDLEQSRFELLAPPEKMAGPSVRRIVEDPDGTVWFCHDAWPDARLAVGLSALRKGRWHHYGAAQGITRPVLTYFRASNEEQYAVLLGHERQLLRKVGDSWLPILKAKGFAWTMAETPEHGVVTQLDNRLHFNQHGQWSAVGLAEEYPFHIFSSSAGELLSCRPKGDHSLVIGRWTGTVFETISPSIYTNGAWLDAVKEAPDGAIWMVGEDALFRWDRKHSEWMHFPGLPWPEVVDGQGDVWFAGEGRVFQGRESAFTLVSSEPGRLVAAGREHVWAWNSTGALLLGKQPPFTEVRLTAAELGLAEIDGMAAAGREAAVFFDRGAAAYWRPQNQSLQALPENPGVTAAASDRVGQFAFLLSNQTSGLRVITAGGKLSASWPEPSRNRLLADERGGFWAYGIGGVLHLPKLEASAWTDVTGLRGRNVLYALEGNTGIWFAFDGSSGGTSGLARRSGDAWEQIPLPVNGALSLGADGTLLAGGPGCIYVLPREDWKKIHRLSLPGNGQPRRLVVDGAGDIWVGLIGANGAISTYRYRPDKVPPAVQIVHCPQEITALEPLRIAVAGIARFRLATERERFQYAWRLDSANWSAFQDPIEGELRIDGIASGIHQVEIQCRDEALDVSRTPATAMFSVLPSPLQTRRWFRPAVWSVFGAMGCLALFALAAARRYRGVNRELQREIGDRQSAQADLSFLNAELEHRVEERTLQLEKQIAARQYAAVKFQAVLSERNRLGRELHDGLQQNLFTVALQVEAATAAVKDPSRTSDLLSIAGDLLRQSQRELRRSVNDLRSQLLENYDLGAAFGVMCRQLVPQPPPLLRVETQGTPRRFEGSIESALFRIGQEAVSNALKHSAASEVMIELNFCSPTFALSIRDNGSGFEESRAPSAEQGHFGLLGMRERATRLGASFSIDSSPAGTTILVVLPPDEPTLGNG